MKFLGVIPARYQSTRFPGKPLVEINGKTMIQRVYEQTKKSVCLSKVVVATDDARIFDEVKKFGGNVLMTSSAHESGTERCNEVLEKATAPYGVVVNIQGDEPFIDPKQIDLLCSCFDDEQTDIATLIKKITTNEELFNPNRPKVELTKNSFAKMFSREAIPALNDIPRENWLDNHTFYKHIGIYGYRAKVLSEICKLSPSPLEQKERLEQLRWLENGYQIKTAVTDIEAFAIDTPEDLEFLLSNR